MFSVFYLLAIFGSQILWNISSFRIRCQYIRLSIHHSKIVTFVYAIQTKKKNSQNHKRVFVFFIPESVFLSHTKWCNLIRLSLGKISYVWNFLWRYDTQKNHTTFMRILILLRIGIRQLFVQRKKKSQFFSAFYFCRDIPTVSRLVLSACYFFLCRLIVTNLDLIIFFRLPSINWMLKMNLLPKICNLVFDYCQQNKMHGFDSMLAVFARISNIIIVCDNTKIICSIAFK